MAQIFYTTVPVIGAENQPVELDLNNLFQSSILKPDIQENSIVLDEGDIFQCGKCHIKLSFSEFIAHKKSDCQGVNGIVINADYSLNDVRVSEDQPVVLGNNIITYMQNNESSNLCQNLDIQSDISSINLDCESYRIVRSDQALSKIECILDNTEIDCFDGSFNEKESNKDSLEKKGKSQKNVDSKPNKCSFCDKVFRKKSDLQQHIRSHTGERPFLCVICGKGFTQKSNVIKHMSTHKVWPKKICNLPKFHVHVNSTGTSVTAYQVAGDETFIAFDKTFFCQYCPSAFNNYSDWRLHIKTHVDVKVYKCIQNTCDSTFSDLDQFLEHTQTHWGMAHYTCQLCQQEFKSLDDLGQHQSIHSYDEKKTNKMSTCEKCGYKFNESSDHKCVVYKCPMCNRGFYSVRFMRRHLALHNAAPTHLCQDCNKYFKTPYYLSVHCKRVHSNEKPFVCDVCSASFKTRDRLVRHSLTHNDERQFKCTFFNEGCTKEFKRKDKLKQHIKLAHSKSTEKDAKSDQKSDDFSQIELLLLPIKADKSK